MHFPWSQGETSSLACPYLKMYNCIIVLPFLKGLSMFQNLAIPHWVLHISNCYHDAFPCRISVFQSIIL